MIYQSVYKIRDKNTGKFSSGGTDPKWSQKGKLWYSEGHVRCAITNWKNTHLKTSAPSNWEIVEFMLQEMGSCSG